MLRIEIVNDGTANKVPENIAYPPNEEPYCMIGNYDYRVFINDVLIDQGRLEDCFRFHGWKGILSCLDKTVNGDVFDDKD